MISLITAGLVWATAAARGWPPSHAWVDSAQIRIAALSPDHAMVAFESEVAWNVPGDVWVVSTRPGSRPRRLASGTGVAWSRDGKQLAFQSLTDGVLQIWTWDRATDSLRQITRLKDGVLPSLYVSVLGAGQQAVRLSWSPDGRRIVFSSRVREPDMPAGDSLPIVLDEHSPSPRVWAGILRYTFGGWQYEGGVPKMQMLPDSVGLRRGNEVIQLLVADVRTGLVTQLTGGTAGAFDADWSPDGAEIAFASGEGAPMLASRLRAANMHVIRADGTGRRVLTSGEGRRFSPRWSSDGKLIAFEYQADAYAKPSLRVLDRRSLAVTTDSAAVQELLRKEFPSAGRTGAVVNDASSITVRLANGRMQRVVDWPKYVSARDAVERVSWRGARGDRISGRLRYPRDYRPGTRYPLVVDPYAEWQTPDSLTNAGYVVFSPNPRAPHNPGNDSHWYRQLAVDSSEVALEIMTDDVMTGIDTLTARGLVDTTRMAIVGFSNGAGVVNYLVTRTSRFRCAVAQSPTSGDLTSTFFLDPDGEYLLTFMNGRAPWDAPAAYVALSPIYRVDRITVPMLLAIGDQEGIPFIAYAMAMYDGLRRLRRPVTLVRYPGQVHGLTGWAEADLGARARKFIDACTGSGKP